MAETDDRSNTSDDDEWPLLWDFLAVVIEHAKLSKPAANLSIPAAKQLILDFYAEAKRPFGYRYQSVEEFAGPGSRPGQGIDPRHWRGSVGSRRLGVHVVVDWENATVTQFNTAPDLDDSPAPDLIVEALRHLREFSSPEPVYQIRLVRLCAGDASTILQWAGFIEPPAAVPNSPNADVSTSSDLADGAVAGSIALPPLERFVYEDMKAHRSELGDRGYTRKVHERALIVHPLGPGEEQKEEEARLKTIRNYVSTYRRELAPDTVQRRRK